MKNSSAMSRMLSLRSPSTIANQNPWTRNARTNPPHPLVPPNPRLDRVAKIPHSLAMMTLLPRSRASCEPSKNHFRPSAESSPTMSTPGPHRTGLCNPSQHHNHPVLIRVSTSRHGRAAMVASLVTSVRPHREMLLVPRPKRAWAEQWTPKTRQHARPVLKMRKHGAYSVPSITTSSRHCQICSLTWIETSSTTLLK